MKASVIDNNVLVAANGKADHVSIECIKNCIESLEQARNGLIVIDDRMRILQEYLRYANLRGEPGVGDAFFRWLWDNQADTECCERVAIRETDDDFENYEEFPKDSELAGFDKSDRKFVAVALASEHQPSISVASDRGWRKFQEPIKRHGIEIDFVC